jgi:hypothetical protein
VSGDRRASTSRCTARLAQKMRAAADALVTFTVTTLPCLDAARKETGGTAPQAPCRSRSTRLCSRRGQRATNHEARRPYTFEPGLRTTELVVTPLLPSALPHGLDAIPIGVQAIYRKAGDTERIVCAPSTRAGRARGQFPLRYRAAGHCRDQAAQRERPRLLPDSVSPWTRESSVRLDRASAGGNSP